MPAVLAGGDGPERDGYCIKPTSVRDIADSAGLVREEQFGPLLPVLAKSSKADARGTPVGAGYGGPIGSVGVRFGGHGRIWA